MIIYKPYGSKDRLFEMFQKVNNINLLNEDDQNINTVNNDKLVSDAFEKLKNDELNNNISSNAITNDNETIIDVNCKDNNGIEYKFKFKVTYTTEADEQVIDVDQTSLIGLIINNNGNEINIDNEAIDNFNNNYADELFSVVNKYFDTKKE